MLATTTLRLVNCWFNWSMVCISCRQGAQARPSLKKRSTLDLLLYSERVKGLPDVSVRVKSGATDPTSIAFVLCVVGGLRAAYAITPTAMISISANTVSLTADLPLLYGLPRGLNSGSLSAL